MFTYANADAKPTAETAVEHPSAHHLVFTWDNYAVLLTTLTIKAGIFIYCRNSTLLCLATSKRSFQ